MSNEDERRDHHLPRPEEQPAGNAEGNAEEGSGPRRAPGRSGVSRRGFLQALGLSATAAAMPQEGILGRVAAAEPPSAAEAGPGAVPVTLKVNGKTLKLRLEPRVTLLDALRDHINIDTSEAVDITGAKRVCDRGSCGACTIIIDGKTVYACTTLAIAAQGKDIRTVEGLAPEGELSPLQEEFVHADGLMCGFCTPGFVVSASALLEANPNPSREEIRRALDGNICRCGTQPRALEAVENAAKRMRK